MALGRNDSVVNTGLADQTPNLVLDYNAERDAAIERKIEAYEAAGKDTKHLKAALGSATARAKAQGPSEALGVRVDVPQPMEPGEVERGVPLSPRPDTVPEPEDGSAPDKRAQDQTPVTLAGSEIVVGPKDGGPEDTRANALPVQPQPGVLPEAAQPRKTVEAQAKAAQELADKGAGEGPAVGDETDEEAKARRAVANQTVPAPDVEPRPTQQERVEAAVAEADAEEVEAQAAPAKRAPAKKAPAKKATARRGR